MALPSPRLSGDYQADRAVGPIDVLLSGLPALNDMRVIHIDQAYDEEISWRHSSIPATSV